jgi:hypothetical protein
VSEGVCGCDERDREKCVSVSERESVCVCERASE